MKMYGIVRVGVVVAVTMMLGISPSLASINQQFFLSDNNKLYFVVVSNPSANSIGAQMTTLMMTSGSAIPVNETANNPPDPVVTSFAHSLSGQILRFPPLSNIKRTALITGLTSNNIVNAMPCNPLTGCFDPFANGGTGLLTLPGGAGTVAFDNTGTIPIQDVTNSSGAGNTLVPSATTTTITRRIGMTTFTNSLTIVFPNPAGPVVTSQGSTCTVASVCTGAGVVCSPTNGNADCPAGQTCTCYGGETAGQNVTIDDTLTSRVGNPASQGANVDGIFIPNTTAMIVFLVDDGSASFGLTADGFAVTGTCSNDDAVPCTVDGDCSGGTCTDGLASRNTVNTTGDIDNNDFNPTPSFTPSNTPTVTATATATNTATVTNTVTSTATSTSTTTQTATLTPSATFTETPTRTATATETPTRPPIPVVPSPTSPAGLVMVGSLALGMLWALRRLMASR